MINLNQKEKILELLYTGELANDWIAFEIIQNLEVDKNILYPLFVVQLLTKDFLLRGRIQKYLVKDLGTEFEPSAEQSLIRNLMISRNIEPFEFERFRKSFSNEEILNLLFFLVMRTGKLGFMTCFLMYDNEKHPKRKLVLEKVIDLQLSVNNYETNYLAGLNYNELDLFAKKCWTTKDERIPKKLELQNLKTKSLPPIFSEYSFKKVYLKSLALSSTSYFTVFPQYIFSFKKITSLSLPIDTADIFPKDCNSQLELKELILPCRPSVVFESFDFLKLFSNLETIKIIGGMISHPNILLGLNRIKIVLDDLKGFKSKSNYIVRLNKEAISDIALHLNQAPITEKKREHYFSRFLALSNLENLSSFSDEELKQLEIFVPNDIGKKRVFYWAIQRELALRNPGQEIDTPTQ